MEPYLAYFQSEDKEFFATVVSTRIAPDGSYSLSYQDKNGELQTATLAQYRVTVVNSANKAHFEERLRNFKERSHRGLAQNQVSSYRPEP